MPLFATTRFRHTLRTRTFGMIVRRTRVLYRTKLFHGLRTFASHHFHCLRWLFHETLRYRASGLRPILGIGYSMQIRYPGWYSIETN